MSENVFDKDSGEVVEPGTGIQAYKSLLPTVTVMDEWENSEYGWGLAEKDPLRTATKWPESFFRDLINKNPSLMDIQDEVELESGRRKKEGVFDLRFKDEQYLTESAQKLNHYFQENDVAYFMKIAQRLNNQEGLTGQTTVLKTFCNQLFDEQFDQINDPEKRIEKLRIFAEEAVSMEDPRFFKKILEKNELPDRDVASMFSKLMQKDAQYSQMNLNGNVKLQRKMEDNSAVLVQMFDKLQASGYWNTLTEAGQADLRKIVRHNTTEKTFAHMAPKMQWPEGDDGSPLYAVLDRYKINLLGKATLSDDQIYAFMNEVRVLMNTGNLKNMLPTRGGLDFFAEAAKSLHDVRVLRVEREFNPKAQGVSGYISMLGKAWRCSTTGKNKNDIVVEALEVKQRQNQARQIEKTGPDGPA